jgi:hypothetical protein
MKGLMGIRLSLVVLLLAVVGAANAATVTLGTSSPGPTLNANDLGIFSNASSTQVAINDNWWFTIGSMSGVAGSAAALLVTGISNISSFVVKVFDSSSNQLFSGGAPAGTQVDFTLQSLASGSYRINITGMYSGSNGGSYSGNVAMIPLPAAAWLLLSGLVGLGAVARRRKVIT